LKKFIMPVWFAPPRPLPLGETRPPGAGAVAMSTRTRVCGPFRSACAEPEAQNFRR